MSTSSQNENSYVILDAESSVELARLLLQDRILTKELGLLPDSFNLSSMHAILDVGCGPGGWALEAGKRFPTAHVVGIDISPRMVEYANTQREALGLTNVTFTMMNALRPLTFPDNTFDLVHGRLVSSFMSKAGWSSLLQECRRVSRPGGITCLNEYEIGGTNSSVLQQFYHKITQAWHLASHSFSTDDYLLGVTFMLRKLLLDAQYQNTQSKAYFFDASAGTEAHEPTCQNILAAFKLLQPFLIKSGLTTQEEMDQLYQQLPAELFSEDFCIMWYYLSAWGEKPASP